MSSIKDLIDVQLSQKLSQSPEIMQPAGVRGQVIAIDIEDVGAWSFRFDGLGNVKMEHGVAKDNNCLVQTNEKTFDGMLKGSVNVPFAYMMRKIKVKGDLNLAVKVGMGIQKAIEGKG